MRVYGEYRHVIDAKNRLFIPAKLREELGESFYITKKVMEKCLAIYSEEEWQRFSEKLNTLPDSKAGKIKKFIFSKTAQVTPDAHGRILVPANLIAYAAAWDAAEAEIDIHEMEDLFCQLGL